MKNITIKPYDVSQLAAISELQAAYTTIYPDAPIMPGEVYLSPAFEDGRNVLCAVDESGQLLGYAPLYPVLMRDPSNLPHTLWTEVKVHPKIDAPNNIKDCILDQNALRLYQGLGFEVIRESRFYVLCL